MGLSANPVTRATQLVTLGAHIRANVNPVVVAALAIRDDVTITTEYNKAATPAVSAWRYNMRGLDLWKAMTLTQYDGITQASKRELWMKWIDVANLEPVDFGRQENRNAVTDIWVNLNASQMVALLGRLTEQATVFETAFPITPRTGGSGASQVTAGDRSVTGPCTLDDISDALNKTAP